MSKGFPGFLNFFVYEKKDTHYMACWMACVSRRLGPFDTDGDTVAIVRPDMEAIREAVQDTNSPYYYPRLIGRYLGRDTTLTTDDYLHLYLGYSFQDDYDPYRVSSYETSLDTLYRRCDYNEEECQALIRYAEQVLADNPFDMRRMTLLAYVHNLLGHQSEVVFWQTRIHHLLDAILSTGDGRTPQTAWYIIEPVHAYDLLNTLGVVAESYEFRPPCYDYIQVYDLIGNAVDFIST